MKNFKILKSYIRLALQEQGPYLMNVMSHDLTSRDQIGSLARRKDDDEDIAPHLREPEVDMEDCYGPVPPVVDDPGVYADPFSRDYHVLPTSTIKRG
jgi:hypothetical protein